MFDPKILLNRFVNSGIAGGFAGGLAGGLLGNALTGKKAKKYAGSALKLGGAAVIGGVAYNAWQNYQRAKAGAPGSQETAGPTEVGAFFPARDDTQGANDLSILLARAMIAAAKADGQIDSRESQSILNHINSSDLPSESKAFLFDAYSKPLDLVSLCEAVDSPEHGAEVYAASLLMVDPPSPAERIYLDSLARELKLEAGLVGEIQATLEADRAAA